MNNAPITISGIWCPHCGRFIANWRQDESRGSDMPIAVYTCPECGKETELAIAWDDLDKDDRPLLEVVS